ncbi:4'-phosphopantetheinyl transferase superfamily protein [Rhizobium sp. VS19-DR104.2]|uniref:4'-phosphopantetheinyl transferase family protein n=1 Tax=unclassified Rhizobium TaxID=2613769 RepID=UPI001CC62850|nr:MULTISPECIES: 4'-phosphopantetheinyl transferase superfamily protein [unclassified Rhizobium]MBZ5763786.1 4'-phosphopantetheinyl transferase superfamily protein [Rhizobium sp. VS19-DR96]MBZ5769722.1 4'-phosphopantetheinyl transferase superfamily protein [Rhizobium sp. VS19-DR129.2]MBZ5777268.1 4'-phosphopantetheinyl transferase superfamily protein [Rhizobium sp. VS19-DRK62.2]MBZ5788392.1 4'-phosphopantetheinyl transferase superfamily protein [Rhizobium sp. VS19-DR121]MBZ5805840.1 4'-phospho
MLSKVPTVLPFGEALNVKVGYKSIEVGDENLLKDEEVCAFKRYPISRQRQSGAARHVARSLLSHWGGGNVTIPKNIDGAPTWPEGIVGSIAHDDTVAMAIVASDAKLRGVGIDVEPDLRLPVELVPLVLTPREQASYCSDVEQMKQIFVIKEAVYKSWYPTFKQFLDFQDIELDLEQKRAYIARSNTFLLTNFFNTGHLIGLAYFYNAAPI